MEAAQVQDPDDQNPDDPSAPDDPPADLEPVFVAFARAHAALLWLDQQGYVDGSVELYGDGSGAFMYCLDEITERDAAVFTDFADEHCLASWQASPYKGGVLLVNTFNAEHFRQPRSKKGKYS